MHLCDNPICVRVDVSPAGTAADGGGVGEALGVGGQVGWGHVMAGTQSHNLSEMARKGRGNGWAGPTRADRAARSRALDAAVRSWD